jgi:pyrimidine 5'-nucleotidase
MTYGFQRLKRYGHSHHSLSLYLSCNILKSLARVIASLSLDFTSLHFTSLHFNHVSIIFISSGPSSFPPSILFSVCLNHCFHPLSSKYYQHNQSVKGLREVGYEFDDEEYWRVIRKGMENFFTQPDLELKAFLEAIPLEKYIFTNCHETSAEELLDHLGVRDCFKKKIFGAAFMGKNCKPDRAVFEKVFAELEIEDPSQLILFEDSYKNLITANAYGMGTVFIDSKMTAEEEGVTEEQRKAVSCVIRSLSAADALKSVSTSIPELF